MERFMVVTPNEAGDWAQACTAFKSAGEEGFDTLEDVQAEYVGLTEDSACNWAIYGLVVQDELTLELYFGELAKYIQDLRAQNLFLRDMMNDRQKVMDEQLKKLQQATESSSEKTETIE
jgi:hypothetical protein